MDKRRLCHRKQHYVTGELTMSQKGQSNISQGSQSKYETLLMRASNANTIGDCVNWEIPKFTMLVSQHALIISKGSDKFAANFKEASILIFILIVYWWKRIYQSRNDKNRDWQMDLILPSWAVGKSYSSQGENEPYLRQSTLLLLTSILLNILFQILNPAREVSYILLFLEWGEF